MFEYEYYFQMFYSFIYGYKYFVNVCRKDLLDDQIKKAMKY